MKQIRVVVLASRLSLTLAVILGLAFSGPPPARLTESSAAPAAASSAAFTVDSTVDAVDANPGDGLCATAAGECTLRAAIQETNALAGNDSITLPAGTYTLTIPGANEDAAATGDLDITGNLTLTGDGAATTIIDGNGIDRVLHIPATPAVSISDVTISGGYAYFYGYGGGIYNSGTLSLIDSTLSDNTAYGSSVSGGGVYNSGTLTVTGSAISNNTAANATKEGDASGGAVYSFGGTVTILDSTISGNHTTPGDLYGSTRGVVYT